MVQQTNTRRGSQTPPPRLPLPRAKSSAGPMLRCRSPAWTLGLVEKEVDKLNRDILIEAGTIQRSFGPWSCGNNTRPPGLPLQWHCSARTAVAPIRPIQSLLPPQCQGVLLLHAALRWPRSRRVSSPLTTLCPRPLSHRQCDPRCLNLFARPVCPVASESRVLSILKTLPSAMSNTS